MARDVVILGGGIAGLSSAWHAAERGHAVTLVERGEGPDHDGCSLGNAGYLCPSHVIPLASPGLLRTGLKMMWRRGGPFGIRRRFDPGLWSWCLQFARSATKAHTRRSAPVLRQFEVASLAGFETWERRAAGAFELHRRGSLMLCATQHAVDDEAALVEFCRGMDIPAQMLNPAELAAMEPEVTFNVLGASYFPDDAHVDPHQVIHWLRRDLAARGVRLLWDHEVTGWKTTGHCIQAVRTSHGDVSGDVFVLAAGAWSGVLARELGLRLPLQAGRGHMFEQPPKPLRTPAILTEARVALTPLPDRLRIGGTMELGGLDLDFDPRRIQGMHDAVDRYVPGLADRAATGEVWTGLRPCTPDGLPYLGPTQRWPNLLLAAGHAMLGLSLGPVTGQLIGELIDDEPPSVSIELLRPERFA